MYLLKTFLVSVGICLASATTANEADEQLQHHHRSLIIGGDDAPKGRYPYFASFDHWGGGVLIAPDIILTAGHCNPPPEQPVKVRVNHPHFQSNDLSKEPNDEETFSIVTKQRHPNWYTISWDEAVNDFNIFKISGFSQVQPVTLNRSPEIPVAGDTVTVIGMGSTSPNPETFEQTAATALQEVQLTILSHAQCEASHDSKRNISYAGRIFEKSMICTSGGRHNKKDACAFDSGSPLLMPSSDDNDDNEDVVVGIVSWGEDCADPYFPAVNARVSNAMEWISKTVCQLSDADPSQLVDFDCDQFVTDHRFISRIRRWFQSWRSSSSSPPTSSSSTSSTASASLMRMDGENDHTSETTTVGTTLRDGLSWSSGWPWAGGLVLFLLVYRYSCKHPTQQQSQGLHLLPSFQQNLKQDYISNAQQYGSMSNNVAKEAPLESFQIYNWVPDQGLSMDDNMLDLLLLVTRNSTCREGSMACILARPDDILKDSSMSETPLSKIPGSNQLLFSSIVAVSNNGPFYSTNQSDLHAEIGCLGKCARQGVPTSHCTAYVTMPPCKNCLAALVKAGVRRIVYFRKTPPYLEEIAQQPQHQLVLHEVRDVSQERKARVAAWISKYNQPGNADEQKEIAQQRLERKREKEERKQKRKLQEEQQRLKHAPVQTSVQANYNATDK